jgi:phenylacetate-CoA ligase
LIGYASSINFIAQVALKNNLKVKFKSVISLGDKLYAHYRKNLESAFQCKVYDTYGSSEGFMIGFQYDLDYLYQYTHQTYLEILDDNGNPVPDGVMGNVVVTRLDGFSMPLIRYKLGDLAIKLPKDKYPDKRKLAFPILQQIIGRNTDVLKTPNGNVLNVHFFTGIIEHYQEIEQFRVLQTKINELNIEIIKGEKFTEVVWEKLRKDLSSKLNDPSVKVIYTFVTEIPSSKSGKPEIVKSLIH